SPPEHFRLTALHLRKPSALSRTVFPNWYSVKRFALVRFYAASAKIRFYTGRTAGGHCDHRGARGVAAAGAGAGQAKGQSSPVRVQPQTVGDWLLAVCAGQL